MVQIRQDADTPIQPDQGQGGGVGGGPGRLNLLLSYAGWQPDPWVDALPRLLRPMGVTALRAGSGDEAKRVIQANPVHIAVVDLGLPIACDCTEEAGPKLLEILRRLDAPPPTVVVKSARSQRDDARQIAAALKAGAFAVVDRPRSPDDLEVMLEVLRRCLTRFYRGLWPDQGTLA
jgi:CheY-like chemotaxis protein